MKKLERLSTVVLSSVISLIMGLSTVTTVYAENENLSVQYLSKYDRSFETYTFDSNANVVVVKQASTIVLVFVNTTVEESQWQLLKVILKTVSKQMIKVLIKVQ